MCSSSKQHKLLLEDDTEETDYTETIFEFQVKIDGAHRVPYVSPEFILQGTDLRCQITLKYADDEITYFLFIKDDYENFCLDQPRFKEILLYNQEQNYNVSVRITKDNPTLSTIENNVILNVKYNCKVTIIYKIKKYERISDENSTAYSNLKKMYEDKTFTDVIINVEGEVFSAHKSLLLGNPVFATMLKSDLQENKENVIYIREMDPRVFQIILRYLYLGDTGIINFKELGEEFLVNLIAAADMYQMEYLKKELIKIAIMYINQESAIKLFILSDKYRIYEIKEKCMRYVRNHRESFSDSLEFKNLVKDNGKLAGELLLFIMNNGFH